MKQAILNSVLFSVVFFGCGTQEGRIEAPTPNQDEQERVENGDLVEKQAEIHLFKGVALYELGRHEEAITAFERAIALKPGYKEARQWKEAVLRRLNEHEGVEGQPSKLTN